MKKHNLSLLGCLSLAAVVTTAIAADATRVSATANPPNPQRLAENIPQIVNGLKLTTNPAFWFDYDNDGIKEWIYGSVRSYSLYKFNADLSGQTKLSGTLSMTFDGWINYGNKEEIDAYSTTTIMDFENNAFTELFSLGLNNKNKNSLRPLDFDNDGKPDFWKGKPYDSDNTSGEILTFAGKGTFVGEHISLMTPDEYYNEVITSGGVGLGSPIGIWRPETPPRGANGNSFTQIDINNDGYMDFVDYPSGYFLLNAGGGRFMIDQFGGSVALRDFDGDGTNDVFVYDWRTTEISVQLQHGNGEADVTKLYSGLNCSEPVWICDFDKDGDLDILAAFNSKDNHISNNANEYKDTYLLMFENNGKGKFKRHEYFIEGKINFAACTDYNADGNYELIGWTEDKSTRYSNYFIWSCYLSGLKINTNCEKVAEYKGDFGYNIITPANIDNSGLTRLLFPDAMITLSDVKNTRPNRPAAPKVNYNTTTGEVYISWERGTDKESPSLDLTYALRIGTAPGKGDIMYAYAAADGSRLNMAEVAGSNSSYSDFDAPSGECFYAVEIIADAPVSARVRSRADNGYASRSNVVSTADAGTLTPISSISISSTSGDFIIDGNETEALQLLANVSPAEATIRKVDWAVAEGSDVVSVDSNGLVSVLKDGTATVRATAADGSGVYDEVVVTVSNFSGVEEVIVASGEAKRPNDIYTLRGILVKRNADSDDIRALRPGFYIIGGRKVLVK